MLRKVLKLSASPRKLLRSVLALDDSTHAISLGVAIGIFFGLTPTVGLQTMSVLIFLFLTRHLFYFNTPAALAATYISNPFTMVPLYYFWYRLGSWFVGGHATSQQFEALLNFEGLSGWWAAVCTICTEIGLPMFLGALITAVIGSIAAYPACYTLLNWVRRSPGQKLHDGHSADSIVANPGVEADIPAPADSSSADDGADAEESVQSRCMAV